MAYCRQRGTPFFRGRFRLGMGGGYYDRFLEKISQATIVAVVFREQILEDLPVLAHDITIKNIVYYDLP